MTKASLVFLVLAIVTCGCAYHHLYVEVDAVRIDVESPQSDGLSSTQAQEIFRNIANDLHFTLAPVQENFSVILLSAHAPETNRINNPTISILIENKRICFVSHLYRSDATENFAAAENAAVLFESELSKRHIRYKVGERHETPLGP